MTRYATWKENFAVEVVDMDVNGDAEREAEAKERMAEIKAKVDGGLMFSVY